MNPARIKHGRNLMEIERRRGTPGETELAKRDAEMKKILETPHRCGLCNTPYFMGRPGRGAILAVRCHRTDCWGHYRDFEYMRNRNLKNVTDSALLFTIYSDALEKYGDSRVNRRKALGTMRNIVKGESNNNFIIMFDDGQVIFSGNNLTYKEKNILL